MSQFALFGCWLGGRCDAHFINCNCSMLPQTQRLGHLWQFAFRRDLHPIRHQSCAHDPVARELHYFPKQGCHFRRLASLCNPITTSEKYLHSAMRSHTRRKTPKDARQGPIDRHLDAGLEQFCYFERLTNAQIKHDFL